MRVPLALIVALLAGCAALPVSSTLLRVPSIRLV
jgi:hypothetical protein